MIQTGKQQINLYATHRELIGLLDAVDARTSISYAEAGLFDSESIDVFDDATELEPFRIYLAFACGELVNVRPVSPISGYMKYAVDQLANPHTVSLHFGGVRDGLLLQASQVGTASASKESTKIFRLVLREVHQQFKEIKSFWVGPEAVSLLESGWRLAPTKRSSPKYDLVR